MRNVFEHLQTTSHLYPRGVHLSTRSQGFPPENGQNP